MKTLGRLLFLLFLGGGPITWLYLVMQPVHAQVQDTFPKPRFTIISDRWDAFRPKQTVVVGYTVIHDEETGQEIVCINSGGRYDSGLSCYLTGRSWK